MNKPPSELDGAKVLFWVVLGKENKKTHAIKLYADGVEQAQFYGLVLAQYEKESSSGVYLLYCGSDWEVENDSLYRDVQEAKSEAEGQFVGISGKWCEFE